MPSSPTTHLLVLIHGMWGNTGHLSEVRRIAEETLSTPQDGSNFHILVTETNQNNSTYDGIDWGGERVAKEILARVAELDASGTPVSRISLTGYSMGGLVARYVIGILFQRKFFETITPINFNTFATPHLGLPRYSSWISSLSSLLGPKLLSRTGEQLYCTDKWSTSGRPLLTVMADPEGIFHRGLSLFQSIRIYANALRDMSVPYITAAIDTEDPFVEYENNKIQMTFYEDYPHLIKTYSFPGEHHQPTRSSWFSELRPQARNPINGVKTPLRYALIPLAPLLVPAVFPLLVARAVDIGVASYLSKERIKALEDSITNGDEPALVQILSSMEADMQTTDLQSNTTTAEGAHLKERLAPIIRQSDHPILSDAQKEMARSLNALPIKKEIAFFPDTVSSHGLIIVRDIKFLKSQAIGRSVIKHWVDSLQP